MPPGTMENHTDADSIQAASVSEERPRRRAPKACNFCRQRKLRCGNEKPKCANCRTYAKDCIYIDLPTRSRPSQARIARLEQDNQALQAQLSSLQTRSEHGSVSSPQSNRSTTHQDVLTSPRSTNETVLPSEPEQSYDIQREEQEPVTASSRHLSTLGDQVGYYGRTSALFDEGALSSGVRSENNNTAGRVSERTQLQLMGEATRQRQMEMINYNAGRLDFDGVDPELGMHLLSLHWNRQHHSFLISYRPAFMRDMACQGPYFSKLLLNAIYFGASKFSPRPELRNNRKSAGLPFRQRVRELLGGALDRSKITTIQALLIMTSSLFALGDERSAAWLYAGIAFRMIIDLGMHIDDLSLSAARKLSEEDYEIRRRVFWGAFVVDKIQSLYQGRPMSLQEADTRVPMIFQDNYEELEHWVPFAYQGNQGYPGSPAYSMSTFKELCRLSIIMNEILNKVYAEKSVKRSPDKLDEDLKSLHDDLEKWEQALPLHLTFDNIGSTSVPPPPHVLSLQAMHKVLLILLHRPFVSEGHLHSTSPSIPVNSFVICAMAATKIVHLLRVYDQAFSIQQAPYLMSYATYVSATIHVRIAAQRGSGSEAHASLSTCLSVLGKNEETNWAVMKARTVILNLMTRMNVDLQEPAAIGGPIGASGGTSNETLRPPLQQPNNREWQDMESTPLLQNSDSRRRNDFATDLDMDAIIQSFIHEQQNNIYGSVDANNPYSRFPPIYPTSQAQISDPTAAIQPSFGVNSAGGTGSAWNEMDFQANGTVEDMLFGFNGEAQDGFW